jgi:hypothetical protein
MNKHIIVFILCLLTLIFTSCPSPLGSKPNPPGPDTGTWVRFINDNIFPVSIYSDYSRQIKIADTGAKSQSEPVEAVGGEAHFYLVYHITIDGVLFPYEGEIIIRIDAGEIKSVSIPSLEEMGEAERNKPLSANAYIKIQNYGTSSLNLRRGSADIPLDGLDSSILNGGETGMYVISPGPASGYSLRKNTSDPVDFPRDLTEFTAGFLYSFHYDGTYLVFVVEYKLTLAEILKTVARTPPNAPDAPIVQAADGLLSLRWTAVQGAENYEVYISASKQPPASPIKTIAGTTTVLTGLTNKTAYYIWIKAVNNSGSSDFSPYSIGRPWPNNEKPATPGALEIIPGINQLTINWEGSGGAASYEVFISTYMTRPSSPEITTEKTSAVIRNLENDKIYYIWVRAVNSAGKSEYSPPESGTPTIPTVAPAIPAKPALTAGSRELAVSWQTVEFASAYEVWAGTSDNSAQAQKQGDDISGWITETVIKNLVNETTYYVWVKAKNVMGASGFSLPANAKPSAFAVLPETPILPTLTPGSKALDVNWTPVEGALSYEVWTDETGNPANAQKYGADVSGASVTLTGLTNETTYYIWVKAKNNIGTSEFSPRADGTPSASAATPATPESAPTVIPGYNQLSISWQAVEGANSYEVWAGTDPNPTIAAKRGNDATGLSSVITGLTNGTAYYVWVKAKNAVGTSNFSPMATGTPSASTIAPQAPAIPSVSIGNGQITVTWEAVEGAAAYEVWTGTANNSSSAAQNGEDVSDSLSGTISGLTNGTTYYIWIKAKNAVGTSGFSPVAVGKPIANATALTLSAGNGQLSVSWTAIAGADQYEVFFGTGINPPESAAQTLTAPATSAAISSLVNGTTYNVWVRGKNATGTGAISGTASAKPIGNMEAVTLSAGNGLLTVSWSVVNGADEYEVYHSTSNTIPASPTQTVSTTTAAISSLTNGTTYNVWVKPKNANGAGNESTAVSGIPLAAPGSLTVSSGNQQITVSWAAALGASSYEVYYSTTTTIPAEASFIGTGTSRIITGLTNGTTYNFWVKAVNAKGTSEASPMASAKPVGSMGTVTLITYGSGEFVLSWQAVDGADEYEVYYRTTNTIPASPSQTVSTTTATISGLTNGTTYYVWVKPKNANGVGNANTAASGVPMAAPGSLTINAGTNQITVSWTSVTGASSYEIYYSTTTIIPAEASFTVTGTNRIITDLTNGTTYYFWVKAVNAKGTSGVSPMGSGRPIGNMGTVTLVSGNGQLTANWPAVDGADEYEVYRSTSNSIPANPTQTVSTTTVTFSSLTNGTTYYVWVKGKNANGTGTASTSVNGKPLGTPGIPTLSPGLKQLQVTWTAVAGANEYEVYYGTETPTTLAVTATGTTTTITGLTNYTTYYVRLRAKNANGVSDYGPIASGIPEGTTGLYRGTAKIGTQNLAASLTYISANAVNGDEFFIVLGANESSPPITLNYSNKTVGITLAGYGAERTVTLNANGSLFTINEGVTLTLDKNITLKGRTVNTTNDFNSFSLVYINSRGKLIMNDSSKITDNIYSSNSNDSVYGGGVYVDNSGTFTMNGGTISGNTVTAFNANGGGVYVGLTGTFTMNGGTISDNRTSSSGSSSGGGVHSRGTFNMSGGTISDNTAYGLNAWVNGGGVYSMGTFNMSGGTISGNTASAPTSATGGYSSSAYGGGVFVIYGTFTMYGGTINGNTATASSTRSSTLGGGVYVYSGGTFTKTGGGIITGNVVRNDSFGGVLNNRGQTVYVESDPVKRRETTAGPEVNLDSGVSGAAGGWE